MTIDLYGIPNCDTVRKARRWLKQHAVAYTFHDYKREGVAAELLVRAAEVLGWEALLNRRGTTWRKLDAAERADVDCLQALQLMQNHPSLIKRPLLLMDGQPRMVGFVEEDYAELFTR
ncbi:MAG: ArsC family reductase [Mariprofundales bacterium]|nr:ArsC family reductase [Mariprofundales bacterium]